MCCPLVLGVPSAYIGFNEAKLIKDRKAHCSMNDRWRLNKESLGKSLSTQDRMFFQASVLALGLLRAVEAQTISLALPSLPHPSPPPFPTFNISHILPPLPTFPLPTGHPIPTGTGPPPRPTPPSISKPLPPVGPTGGPPPHLSISLPIPPFPSSKPGPPLPPTGRPVSTRLLHECLTSC